MISNMCIVSFSFGRLLGDLKKSVRNKAKPEGSIIQAWVAYEVLTFCGMYLKDHETTFNRPPRNNDGGVRKEKLSVFAQIARPFGDPICGESVFQEGHGGSILVSFSTIMTRHCHT